jgi:hypothetical protein
MSITIGSVTLSRGLNRAESDYHIERPQMLREILANGEILIYDESSTKVVRGVLVIDYCTADEAASMRAFLANTIRILRFKFDITPDSCSDVGAGAGIVLEDCLLDVDDASTSGIVTPQGEFGRWQVRLPYRAVIAALSGAGVEE